MQILSTEIAATLVEVSSLNLGRPLLKFIFCTKRLRQGMLPKTSNQLQSTRFLDTLWNSIYKNCAQIFKKIFFTSFTSFFFFFLVFFNITLYSCIQNVLDKRMLIYMCAIYSWKDYEWWWKFYALSHWYFTDISVQNQYLSMAISGRL